MEVVFLYSKKRNKLDIIIKALEMSIKNTTKSNIIVGLNVGWNKGQTIFKLLVNKGLIKEVNSSSRYKTNVYSITEKGIDFIKDYKRLINIIDYEIIDRYQPIPDES